MGLSHRHLKVTMPWAELTSCMDLKVAQARDLHAQFYCFLSINPHRQSMTISLLLSLLMVSSGWIRLLHHPPNRSLTFHFDLLQCVL